MLSFWSKQHLLKKEYWLLLAIVLLGIVLATLFMPLSIDWERVFYPAGQMVLAGRSPYLVEGFFNPPWLILPLLPIVLLPIKIGNAVMAVLGLATYAYVLRKFKVGLIGTIFFLLSPPAIISIYSGNADWMIAIGYVLPPQIGLFFVLLKPHVGGGLAIFWLVEAWRAGGIKNVVRVFLPVTVFTLLSFVIFGFWPAKAGALVDVSWNISIWPMSIPIGLALLSLAIRKRNARISYLAAPMLSPYVASGSLAPAIMGLDQVEMVVVSIGLWVMMFTFL